MTRLNFMIRDRVCLKAQSEPLLVGISTLMVGAACVTPELLDSVGV